MKKTNEILLKDALEAFLKESKLDEKLQQTSLLHAWEPVVGNLIARHTTQLYVKNKILHVVTDNAAIRQELTYQRSKLLKKLNDKVGSEVIVDIVFA